MVELVKYMVCELVEDKDAVEVALAEDGETVTVKLLRAIWEELSVKKEES